MLIQYVQNIMLQRKNELKEIKMGDKLIVPTYKK